MCVGGGECDLESRLQELSSARIQPLLLVPLWGMLEAAHSSAFSSLFLAFPGGPSSSAVLSLSSHFHLLISSDIWLIPLPAT